MRYLDTYLKKIRDRGNPGLADSVENTAEEIGEKYIQTFSFTTHEIGLLFGNVQSGKTGQMFGILCKAADLGFPAFLILTTDNVVLQQQTLERVQSDLDGFCICGENDSKVFMDNNLVQPAIVVLKKNSKMLKLWANVFGSTGFMKGNPLFIIDDEADAASLNTMVNKNKQSSINKYLESIKNGASSSIYLQVTGTPQAILLQSYESGWHPYFTHYFAPGKAYLGGDFFFPVSGKSDCIYFLEEIGDADREVVFRHLTVSAQMLLSGEKVSNCLIHPSVRVSAHQTYADNVEKVLQWCRENEKEFKEEIKMQYEKIDPQKSEKRAFDDLYSKAMELLSNSDTKVLILNGEHDVESDNYASGCNFVVGGNTLGRGVTFPSLQTIYYTRTSKKPQADTMWQHSRMFGYDRDPGMMAVYIDEPLYKLFSDINATNNSIISQVERGIEDVKVYYPEGLNPTRKNVLDNKKVDVIPGGTNFYPMNPDNDSVEEIDKMLEAFDELEEYYQTGLRFMRTLLGHIIPSDDFRLDAFISVLDMMLADTPTGQGIIIVRRGRNVSQGTGALLSSNDWQLGARFGDKVVLTMYQVTGTKGWKKPNLWVPNIRLPEGIVYYDVKD